MKKPKLILKDPHMFCVESNMGKASASLNAQDVANRTERTNAMCCIQSWPPQVGEPQIDLREKEIEKEMIGVEEIKEAKQGVRREEEIEAKIGVVNLQSMTKEINHLDHLGKEFRKLTRETGSLILKMTLIKKEGI